MFSRQQEESHKTLPPTGRGPRAGPPGKTRGWRCRQGGSSSPGCGRAGPGKWTLPGRSAPGPSRGPGDLPADTPSEPQDGSESTLQQSRHEHGHIHRAIAGRLGCPPAALVFFSFGTGDESEENLRPDSEQSQANRAPPSAPCAPQLLPQIPYRWLASLAVLGACLPTSERLASGPTSSS